MIIIIKIKQFKKLERNNYLKYNNIVIIDCGRNIRKIYCDYYYE